MSVFIEYYEVVGFFPRTNGHIEAWSRRYDDFTDAKKRMEEIAKRGRAEQVDVVSTVKHSELVDYWEKEAT